MPHTRTSPTAKYQPTLSRRLILLLVLFSSGVTLITTSIQLYGDFRHDIGAIEQELGRLQATQLESLENASWTVDRLGLGIILDSIAAYPFVSFVEVRDSEVADASRGQPVSGDAIVREFALQYEYQDQSIGLGTLRVEASLGVVYSRLLDRLWLILASNAIKTFAVVLFVFFLFRSLVTRHLERIAGYLSVLAPDGSQSRLELSRKQYTNKPADELELVAAAINNMRATLQRSYAQLSESRARLQAVLDHAPFPIWLQDLEGRYVLFNQAAGTFFGIDPPCSVGVASTSFFSDEFSQQLMERHRQVMDCGETSTTQLMTPVLGSVRELWTTHFPIFGQEQELTAVGTISIDMTERNAAERELQSHRDHLEELVNERTAVLQTRTQELERAQEELLRQERLATLGQLSGTVAHEIRNPLGALANSLYIIKQRIEKNDLNVEQEMKRAERSIERCNGIITDLLDYAAIKRPDFQPVAVDEWLEELLGEYAVPEGVTFNRVLGAPGSRVEIDTEQMRRAVFNVLDNACQALTVHRPEATESPRLKVATHRDRQHICIDVTDNGPGIEPGVLPKVFEPLFSTRTFGVGLGLTIVRDIVEQHHGHAEIRSAHASTIVTLLLPLAATSNETAIASVH